MLLFMAYSGQCGLYDGIGVGRRAGSFARCGNDNPREETEMLTKLTQSAMALAFVGATAITAAPQAQAHGGNRTAGVVAGTIIGLGVLGAYAASRDRGYYRSCYPGRQRCEVVGQRCFYNRWGEYICKDNVRCWRPEVCD